jgi:hypothetical protein
MRQIKIVRAPFSFTALIGSILIFSWLASNFWDIDGFDGFKVLQGPPLLTPSM